MNSKIDKDLQVETSCITPFELLLRVLLWSDFAINQTTARRLDLRVFVNSLRTSRETKNTFLYL